MLVLVVVLVGAVIVVTVGPGGLGTEKASSTSTTPVAPTTTIPTLESLTARLLPVCMGSGVPGSAARPLDGSPRTPLIVDLSKAQLDTPSTAVQVASLDAAFDTVACASTKVVDPARACKVGADGPVDANGSYTMAPVYVIFRTQVEVVVRDAATGIEVGRFTHEFPPGPCRTGVAPNTSEYATDWNTVNGELLPLLLK